MAKSRAPFVDLHVHTWHSDGSLSPAQAVGEAVRAGVGVFAVADHESFDGVDEAAPLCAAAGIALVPAAELECSDGARQLHILCYGARRDDAALSALARDSRRKLDDMSVTLLKRMADDYPALDEEDYRTFDYDRSLGGWKGLHYLVARGVTDSLRAGMPYYQRYDVQYEAAGFPALEALVGTIHGAGGRAVLAHPGHSMRALGQDALLQEVEALLDRGLDGVECYYPLHDAALSHALADICRARGRLITAGSDCHGAFGHTRVGEMDVTLDALDLSGIPGLRFD